MLQSSYIWRSILILVTGATLLIQGEVRAQGSINHNAAMKVTIINGLTIVKNRDLNFGVVLENTSATIGVTSASAGKFTIIGNKTKNVVTTLAPPATLSDGNGNSVTYTARASYNNLTDDPATALEWIPPTGLQTGFRPQANQSGNIGEFYIYIFGSVTVATVPAGTYSGLFTITVSY